MYFHKFIFTLVGGLEAKEVKAPASVSKFHGLPDVDLSPYIEPFIDTLILYEPFIS